METPLRGTGTDDDANGGSESWIQAHPAAPSQELPTTSRRRGVVTAWASGPAALRGTAGTLLDS